MKTHTALIFSAALLASTIQTGALALDSVTTDLSAGRPALAAGDAPSSVKVAAEPSSVKVAAEPSSVKVAAEPSSVKIAAESTDAETSTTKATDKTDEKDSKQSEEKHGMFKNVSLKSLGPGPMAAFVAGTVVGLPVGCVRSTLDETQQANNDLVKGSKNPILVVPATMLALPFTVPIGTLFGTFHAIKNSWENRSAKPYSKDAFSLGDDY